MQWISGDTGRPHSPAFVPVGHRAVLIDLSALYPNAPHFDGTYQPEGLQIRAIHLGVLTEWGRDEWGAWYGKVTYTITAKNRKEKVTHWVPAWALRPADARPPGGLSRG